MNDSAARLRVRRDFAHNLRLSAGAGAGKTEELTRRAAHWLIHGAPDSFNANRRQQALVMLTFTEAAAAEMGDRLEGLLDKLCSDEGYSGDSSGLAPIGSEIIEFSGMKREQVAQRARELLSGSPLRVSTFHAFCLELLRDYGERIGIGGDLRLESAEPKLLLIRRRAAWETVREAFSGPNPIRLERPFRSDWLVEVLVALCPSPWVPAHRLERLPEILSSAQTYEFLQSMAQSLKRLREILADLPGSISGSAPARRLVALAAQEAPDWTAFEGDLYDLAKKTQLDDDPRREELLTLRQRFKMRGKWREGFWDQILHELPKLLHRMRQVQLEQASIGFDDALRYAVELLHGNADLRRLCHREIRQMMVDEFQDTDPLQCELLHLLHDDDQGHLAAGRLFIVGDEKQSIYNFRGADLQAYKDFNSELDESGAEALELTSNFRSDRIILDAVASGFHKDFGEQAQMIASPNAAQGSLRLFDLEAPDKGVRIADFRRSLVNEVAAKLALRLADASAPRRAQDCAILTRTRKEIPVWVEALNSHGIPARALGDVQALRHPASGDLLNLLALCSGKGDAATAFGLLQSPLIGFSQGELLEASQNGLCAALADEQRQLPENSPQRVQQLRQLRLLFAAGALPAFRAELEEQGWVPGPWTGDTQVSANLASVLDLFMAAAGDAEEDMQAWFNLHRSGPDHPSAALSQDSVIISTQHGAKGLQWPLVIVARLPSGGGGGGGGAPPTLITNNGKLAIRVAKGPWMGQVEKLSAASKAISAAESVRLTYVACTRPQHELWIAASAADTKEPLGLVLARLSQTYPIETVAGSDFEAQPPRRYVDPQRSLNPEIWKQRQAPISVSPSQIGKGQSDRVLRSDDEHGLYAQIAEPSSQSGSAPVDIYATALGEVVHLALEHFDFSLPFAEQVRTMVSRAVEQMKEQLPDEHTAGLLVEAQEILTSFAASGLAAELGSVEVLAKELAFSCPTHWLDTSSEAQIGTGFIDLLYRRADGTVVVADWKITRSSDHEALKQRYSRQLQAYAEVVRPLVPGSRVEAELILVRSAERIAIEL